MQMFKIVLPDPAVDQRKLLPGTRSRIESCFARGHLPGNFVQIEESVNAPEQSAPSHRARKTGEEGRKSDSPEVQQKSASLDLHTPKPFVSILIPAYNAQEWIADTLLSAIAQTWPRKEIIIVDDGSIDQTLAIARQFESENVRAVTQKNQGAASARNLAFSLSKGDYIQWLDADDLLAPDKITRQMDTLKQPGSQRDLFSSAWGKFMYRPHRAKFVADALWDDLPPADFLVRKMGRNLYMPIHAWLVSRELTEAAGAWDTTMHVDDDGEYFCRVLLACDRVRFVPEAKAYCRISGFNSLSNIGLSDKKIEAQWRSIQLHIGYLRSLEESERVRDVCVRLLQDWLIYFYPEKPEIFKQAEEMARNLGGQLRTPSLNWKYAWVKMLFGWTTAKRAQQPLRKSRWELKKFLDKTLYRMEKRKASGQDAAA
jgi:glycosyltransferase involved in cell wall biosynthesis